MITLIMNDEDLPKQGLSAEDQLASDMVNLYLTEPLKQATSEMKAENTDDQIDAETARELIAGLRLLTMEDNRVDLFKILYSRCGEENLRVTVRATEAYIANPVWPLHLFMKMEQTRVDEDGIKEEWFSSIFFSEDESDKDILARYTEMSRAFPRPKAKQVVEVKKKRILKAA